MRTTIHLPDELFERAEALASSLGVSRSQLYFDALCAYLDRRQEEEIRAALDAVHGEAPEPIEKGLERAQAKVLRDSEW